MFFLIGSTANDHDFFIGLEKFDYHNLPDSEIVRLLDLMKYQHILRDNWINDYLIKIINISGDNYSSILMNQIKTVFKNIKELNYLHYNSQKSLIHFQKSFNILANNTLTQGKYSEINKNYVLHDLLVAQVALIEYQRIQYFENAEKNNQLICVAIVNLLLELMQKIKQNYSNYDAKTTIKMNFFFDECLKIINLLQQNYQYCNTGLINEEERQFLLAYKDIFNQFIKIAMDVIIYKLNLLNKILEEQNAFVLGRFKAILSSSSRSYYKKFKTTLDLISATFCIDFYSIQSLERQKFIQLSNYADLNFATIIQTTNQQSIIDNNYKNNQALLGKLKNELQRITKIPNGNKQVITTLQGYLIMSMIYLYIQQTVSQYNQYFFVMSAMLNKFYV